MLFSESVSNYKRYRITLPQQLSVIFLLGLNLFIRIIQSASSSKKYHIIYSRLSQERNSFTPSGADVWNCFLSQTCKQQKPASKKKIREALFTVLATGEEYVEASVLLL